MSMLGSLFHPNGFPPFANCISGMADMLCKENVNVETEQDDSTKGQLVETNSMNLF